MSISAEEFQQLSDRVAELTQIRDQAAGALAELKKRLWDDFQCRNLDEAKALMKKMETQERQLTAEYEKQMRIVKGLVDAAGISNGRADPA